MLFYELYKINVNRVTFVNIREGRSPHPMGPPLGWIKMRIV